MKWDSLSTLCLFARSHLHKHTHIFRLVVFALSRRQWIFFLPGNTVALRKETKT